MLRLDYEYMHPGFRQTANLQTDCRTIGIFGPSGGGKTTLLNIIAGTASPSKGLISLDNTTLFDKSNDLNIPTERRSVGYVFQDNQLFPHLDVRSNVFFGFDRLKDNTKALIAPHSVVELLELKNILDRPVKNLSGGEAKRVAVARALARSPEILLLDEPFSGMDRKLSDRLLSYLIRIRDSLNITIIYVSHNIRELISFCKLVAPIENVFDENGIKQSYIAQLYDPLDFFSRQYIRGDALELENNIICSIENVDINSGITTLITDSGNIILAPIIQPDKSSKMMVSFSAGEVILARDLKGHISARNRWECKVSTLKENSGLVILTLDCGFSFHAEVTKRTAEEMNLAVGANITALIKVNSLRLTPV